MQDWERKVAELEASGLTPEEQLAQRERRARSRRRVALGVVVAGVAAAFLWFAPPWMIARADASDTACSNRDDEVAPGESEGCGWRARAWLVLPKLVPWTRANALRKARSLDLLRAARALRRATRVTLDPRARDEAAAALFAAWASRDDATSGDPTGDAIGQLVLAGAPAKALELGGDAGKSPRLAFLAALSLGDLERATSLARREDATPSCPET